MLLGILSAVKGRVYLPTITFENSSHRRGTGEGTRRSIFSKLFSSPRCPHCIVSLCGFWCSLQPALFGEANAWARLSFSSQAGAGGPHGPSFQAPASPPALLPAQPVETRCWNLVSAGCAEWNSRVGSRAIKQLHVWPRDAGAERCCTDAQYLRGGAVLMGTASSAQLSLGRNDLRVNLRVISVR